MVIPYSRYDYGRSVGQAGVGRLLDMGPQGDVGGGNVAMDVARSSVRLGAENVYIAYRRRKKDMTALPEEVEGAIAEGCEVLEMFAPDSVKVDEQNQCVAMCLRPQMAGAIDRSGRPSPVDAPAPIMELACDIVVVAIGQNIQWEYFDESGIPCNRGTIAAGDDTIMCAIRTIEDTALIMKKLRKIVE